MIRKISLVNDQIYHVFSRSIADYVVFNNSDEFFRMIQLLKYYQIENHKIRFSDFIEFEGVHKKGFNNFLKIISTDKQELVQIIAYCLMPTHIHLILKQLINNGISIYIGKILNSYSRYFNIMHKRKGHLWEDKFKNVLVRKDEQLLHLTRYTHLNPVTAYLVKKPEDWVFSSYNEYLGKINDSTLICQYEDILEIDPKSYRKFVNNQISYQKELAKIKKLLLD